MRTVKDIICLLGLATIIVGMGQFLPGLSVLFDNYLVGFFLTVAAILIFRVYYKAHMARVAKLPPAVREKREKESQEWWEETNRATFCPSEQLDLRNMTNISSPFDDD